MKFSSVHFSLQASRTSAFDCLGTRKRSDVVTIELSLDGKQAVHKFDGLESMQMFADLIECKLTPIRNTQH